MKLRGGFPIDDEVSTEALVGSMKSEGIPVKLFPDTPDERIIGKARVIYADDEVVEFELDIDYVTDIDAGRWGV